MHGQGIRSHDIMADDPEQYLSGFFLPSQHLCIYFPPSETDAGGCLCNPADHEHFPPEKGVGNFVIPFVLDLVDVEQAFVRDGVFGNYLVVGLDAVLVLFFAGLRSLCFRFFLFFEELGVCWLEQPKEKEGHQPGSHRGF